MENMDKRLTAPKWVLINQPKMPQILSAQIVCPSPKVWYLDEKRLHWTTIVRAWDKFQLSPYDPPALIAGTPLPVESENPKERKMMKKCSKKTCAAAATGAGATSIVEESLPHNCKGNCCRNEQENRKKVVCVLLLLFLLFPTNSSIHSS